jgi:quercetin dioxygenase-like cupin family protein
MEQIENCGENEPEKLASAPPEESQYWPEDGRRITMHAEQVERDKVSGHGATYRLMSEHGNRNGFKALAVGITSIFVEHPRSKSHSHAHPEAYLYALQGKGYSEIGGKQYEWEEGDAVHVPPGMMHHQHFNPSDQETKELRIGFGIRYWYTDQWKGYTTIDRHLRARPIDDDD